MRFTVEYPLAPRDGDDAFAGAEGVTAVARAVDSLGFDAIAFTEHPAPSYKWLNAGGHQSFDVPAALAFCAAVTERVRLMPYLMVLPYHNPFTAAKAVSTVDRLSGGRVSVVAGTGYLRSEFAALKVEMSHRNELFDEALEVMRGLWTSVPFTHRGRHFRVDDVASLPGPVQKGGPPVYIGGNSALSRRRAALHDGWSPLLLGSQLSRTARTPQIDSIEELADKITEVRQQATEVRGEDAEVFIQVQTSHCRFIQEPGSVEEHRDHLGRLAEAGVDSFVVKPAGADLRRTVESLHRYAELFMPAHPQ